MPKGVEEIVMEFDVGFRESKPLRAGGGVDDMDEVGTEARAGGGAAGSEGAGIGAAEVEGTGAGAAAAGALGTGEVAEGEFCAVVAGALAAGAGEGTAEPGCGALAAGAADAGGAAGC